MYNVKKLAGVLAVAAIAALPAAAPAGAHATRRHGKARRVVIHTCVHGTAVAPKTYVLACGDGSTGLEKLRWSHWGSKTATAHGLAFVNDCTPTCVAGKYVKWHVTVKARRLSKRAYHLLVITATRKRPKHARRKTKIRIGRHGPESAGITT